MSTSNTMCMSVVMVDVPFLCHDEAIPAVDVCMLRHWPLVPARGGRRAADRPSGVSEKNTTTVSARLSALVNGANITNVPCLTFPSSVCRVMASCPAIRFPSKNSEPVLISRVAGARGVPSHGMGDEVHTCGVMTLRNSPILLGVGGGSLWECTPSRGGSRLGAAEIARGENERDWVECVENWTLGRIMSDVWQSGLPIMGYSVWDRPTWRANRQGGGADGEGPAHRDNHGLSGGRLA